MDITNVTHKCTHSLIATKQTIFLNVPRDCPEVLYSAGAETEPGSFPINVNLLNIWNFHLTSIFLSWSVLAHAVISPYPEWHGRTLLCVGVFDLPRLHRLHKKGWTTSSLNLKSMACDPLKYGKIGSRRRRCQKALSHSSLDFAGGSYEAVSHLSSDPQSTASGLRKIA